MLADSSYLKSL